MIWRMNTSATGGSGNPIFYNVDIRDGIDAEDTFATYVTENGVAKTKISNVVCIYAPRFAAVRSIASVYGPGPVRQARRRDRRHAGRRL